MLQAPDAVQTRKPLAYQESSNFPAIYNQPSLDNCQISVNFIVEHIHTATLISIEDIYIYIYIYIYMSRRHIRCVHRG